MRLSSAFFVVSALALFSGCAKTRFKPRQWWFPFAGTFPYKGFFKKKDALREKARLEKDGMSSGVSKAKPEGSAKVLLRASFDTSTVIA